MKIALILATLLLAFSVSVSAKPVLVTEFKTYPVDLGDTSDLRLALNRASPVRENGRVYHGSTNWDVSWDFRWQKNNGVCRVSQVTTRVSVIYMLPDATTLPRNRQKKSRYKRYYAALMAHEKGHAKFGSQMAEEVETTLLEMYHRGDCEVFSKAVNVRAFKMLKKYQQMDDRYDSDTGHG